MILEALLTHGAIALGLALLTGVFVVQTGRAGFARYAMPVMVACFAMLAFTRASTGPLAALLLALALVWTAAMLIRAWRFAGRATGGGADAVGAAVAVFSGYLISTPAQYGILEAADIQPISGLALLGTAMFLAGLIWRVRMARTASGADPTEGGLALAWWGVWLASASAGWWVAAITFVGPLLLTLQLRNPDRPVANA